MNDDMKFFGHQLEWVIFRDIWRDFILGKRLTRAKLERNGCFQNK